MKLAVLTGGSDVPGLNAVLRGVVRTAVYRYQADVVGVSQGWEGLLRPPEVWTLSPADVRGLIRRGGTFLGSCNLGNPFRSAGRDRSQEVLESVRWLGIDAVLCIGGDGSMGIARRLHEQGVPVIGIPKTISDDMGGTNLTFGHVSGVQCAVEAIDKLQTTRETGHRVMYLQVMGRSSGWSAVRAGIAGGADAVLIPEIPYRPECVAEVIERRRKAGKYATIVVVADGARREGEAGDLPDEDTAMLVADQVAQHSDADFRVTVLGHLQRGGDPIGYDRILATRFGAMAVKAAHEGAFGQMVALRDGAITLVPLSEGERLRALSRDHELIWTAASVGISLGVPLAELSTVSA
jgi:6-phosphofructokinase 1